MERVLVTVRHGQSEWNLQNRFTGWKNPGLTPLGIEEARSVGRELKKRDLAFTIAFSSMLQRAQHTLDLILDELGQKDIPVLCAPALNERHYGDLAGLSKDEACRRWGEEQVHQWRRSYDVAPPGGESLKDTSARILPYYCHTILPHVLRGGRVLLVSHENSLRALAMALDGLTAETVRQAEFANGGATKYRFNPDSTVASKRVLNAEA
jgi:2,3-bisphosphoglycerate-dependent phosphoglycerate mutase